MKSRIILSFYLMSAFLPRPPHHPGQLPTATAAKNVGKEPTYVPPLSDVVMIELSSMVSVMIVQYSSFNTFIQYSYSILLFNTFIQILLFKYVCPILNVYICTD
jgi:hypothetical protein